jgi:hypothetical protein
LRNQYIIEGKKFIAVLSAHKWRPQLGSRLPASGIILINPFRPLRHYKSVVGSELSLYSSSPVLVTVVPVLFNSALLKRSAFFYLIEVSISLDLILG